MVLSILLLYLINHYATTWPPVTRVGTEYSCCALMYEKTETGMTLEEVKETYYCGYQQLVPINNNNNGNEEFSYDLGNQTVSFTSMEVD